MRIPAAEILNFILITKYVLLAVSYSVMFKIAIVLSVCTAFYVIFQISMRKLKTQIALVQEQALKAKELLDYSKENELKAKADIEVVRRSKSVLIAKLSHEIRTPMNGVIGMAVLLTETNLSEEQRGYADAIKFSADKLSNSINNILISDLVESTESGEGKAELEQKDFNLKTIIEEVLDTFAIKAAETDIELLYEVEKNVPVEIVGDALRLKQVLIHLIENSLRFTHAGEIFISVKLTSLLDGNRAELVFEVRDSGVGIPASKLAQVNALISGEQDDTTIAKDCGAGLILCKKIVSLMGGHMHVRSREGSGTVFSFAITPVISLHAVNANKAFNRQIENKKLLVVDDNATSQYVIKNQLDQWKLHTSLAGSGYQALQILLKESFDAILIDLKMPNMNGLALAQAIKQNKIETPLILMNVAGDEHYKKVQELFSAVISKPLKHAQLYKQLSDELEGKFKPEAKNKNVLTAHFAQQYPLRILVAEDDEINQRIALTVLGKLGYKADLARSGKEALEIVSETNYDLILMDVQMPEMDGLEATRMIRLCLNTQPVIIAMTANAMQGDKEACFKSGMDDYISKPVKLDDLLKALEKWSMHVNDKR